MKINQYQELSLRGVYIISDVSLPQLKYKENRYVAFPYDAKVGEVLMFLYGSFSKNKHGSEGGVFYSHVVEKIETMNDGNSIQISTDDNQWVLNKVC